jgi:SAM-dependent methyltransferase
MSSIITDFQETLRSREAKNPQNQLVLQTIRSLSAAFVYPEPTNVETNRKLWDEYAKSWDNDGDWVQTMAGHVGMQKKLEHVGDEWSDSESLEQVLSEFLFPHLLKNGVVAEIGTGGGRVACRVAPVCLSFTCMDVSIEMLKRAKSVLDPLSTLTKNKPNIKYVHLKGDPSTIPDKFNATYDFIYSFDVFVHLDLHTIWGYMKTMHRMLKDGGKIFLSTSNILAPLGWQRFAKQTKYTVGGFYFISPDIAKKMAIEMGFHVIQESSWDKNTNNVYYERDYLFVLEKKNSDDISKEEGGEQEGGGQECTSGGSSSVNEKD